LSENNQSSPRRPKSADAVIQAYIKPALKNSIVQFAEQEEVPISHIVRRALKEFVDRENKRIAAESGGN
jgi:hypothetical protein